MPPPHTQTPHNNFKTQHLRKRTEVAHFRFQIIETQEEAKSALDKNRSGKHEYPIEVITGLNRQLSRSIPFMNWECLGILSDGRLSK